MRLYLQTHKIVPGSNYCNRHAPASKILFWIYSASSSPYFMVSYFGKKRVFSVFQKPPGPTEFNIKRYFSWCLVIKCLPCNFPRSRCHQQKPAQSYLVLESQVSSLFPQETLAANIFPGFQPKLLFCLPVSPFGSLSSTSTHCHSASIVLRNDFMPAHQKRLV